MQQGARGRRDLRAWLGCGRGNLWPYSSSCDTHRRLHQLAHRWNARLPGSCLQRVLNQDGAAAAAQEWAQDGIAAGRGSGARGRRRGTLGREGAGKGIVWERQSRKIVVLRERCKQEQSQRGVEPGSGGHRHRHGRSGHTVRGTSNGRNAVRKRWEGGGAASPPSLPLGIISWVIHVQSKRGSAGRTAANGQPMGAIRLQRYQSSTAGAPGAISQRLGQRNRL